MLLFFPESTQPPNLPVSFRGTESTFPMKTLRLFRAPLSFLSLFVAAATAFGETTWTLVTDASTLAVGDVVIIAAREYDFAMSTTQNSNNRAATAITKSGNNCTPTESVQQFTLQAGTKSGTFAFYTGSGYIYAASSSSNYLKTQLQNNDNGSWAITISNGEATIVAQGANTRNILLYNTGRLFSCYGSSSNSTKPVSLYRRTGFVAPSIAVSPATATVTHGGTVTATISTNAVVTSVSASVGTLVGSTFTWSPESLGPHTVTFTASDAEGNTDTAELIVTVTASTLAAPVLSDPSNVLADGTGFTASWTAVSGITDYEIQLATNALFDAVTHTLLTEGFDTLTDNEAPDGWQSSTSSDLDYVGTDFVGIAIPSYKFKAAGQNLTSPAVDDNIGKVTFFAYGNNGADSVLTVEGQNNGTTVSGESHDVTIANGRGTYEVSFSSPQVNQVKFTFKTKVVNFGLDDVVFSSVPFDSVVRTSTVPNATSFAVTGLDPNTTYYVRVRSVAANEKSNWSDSVSVHTPSGTTPFPPELTVTPAVTNIAAGGSATFTVVYSDANENDTLTLTLAIDSAAAETLNLASGDSYTYTPGTAGAHRLVFAVTDGQFTTVSTNTLDVTLPAPVAADASGQTEDPWGFRMSWSAVPLAESYEVEVATDPLFEAALGTPVLEEDFSTMTKENPPEGWTASSDGSGNATGLMYTGSKSCGELAPAFRFGNGQETLSSPDFPAAKFVSFFGYITAGNDNSVLLLGYNHGELANSVSIELAEGRSNYTAQFSENVTSIKFEYTKGSGNFGIDDIIVRDVATRDSIVWTNTVAAGTTTTSVTNLPNAKAYYYRVRATSGGAVSEWSDSIEVLFLEAPANVRYEHGKYLDDGFAVAWDAAYGADSYRVVVRESRTEPHVPVLSEDFYDGNHTTGWTLHGVEEYTSIASSGEGPKSIKFNTANSEDESKSDYIISPLLEYPSDSVSFWAKCPSAAEGCQLTISALVGEDWRVIGGVWPTFSDEDDHSYTFDLPEGTLRIRFMMTEKAEGSNIALDDVLVLGTAPVFYDFGTFTTTDTHLPLIGAHADRHFLATVTALSDGGEVSAPTLEGVSPPNNPVTIIRVR